MINLFISVTSHHMLLTPSPVTNCHAFSDPSPSSVTYFMNDPLRIERIVTGVFPIHEANFMFVNFPVSTGIFPHSFPEWAFRTRPGLWRICLCHKVARIAEHKFGSRYKAKLGQTSSFP